MRARRSQGHQDNQARDMILPVAMQVAARTAQAPQCRRKASHTSPILRTSAPLTMQVAPPPTTSLRPYWSEQGPGRTLPCEHPSRTWTKGAVQYLDRMRQGVAAVAATRIPVMPAELGIAARGIVL